MGIMYQDQGRVSSPGSEVPIPLESLKRFEFSSANHFLNKCNIDTSNVTFKGVASFFSKRFPLALVTEQYLSPVHRLEQRAFKTPFPGAC